VVDGVGWTGLKIGFEEKLWQTGSELAKLNFWIKA
jgi:hypothetical protein